MRVARKKSACFVFGSFEYVREKVVYQFQTGPIKCSGEYEYGICIQKAHAGIQVVELWIFQVQS